jgi:hypothetical protein
MSDTPKTVWIENPEITELRAKLTEAEPSTSKTSLRLRMMRSMSVRG